jgi:hypothetical protein
VGKESLNPVDAEIRVDRMGDAAPAMPCRDQHLLVPKTEESAALRGSGWLLSRLSRLGELGGLGQKSHPAEADQFVRQSCQPPRIAIGETVFNDDIAASYPAKLTQSAWNA